MASNEKDGFFRAIQAGKVRSVCGYLETGVDVNEPTVGGYTPLIQAVHVGREDIRSHILRLLVRQGCDVNKPDKEGRTALMHACMLRDRDDAIRRIISTGTCDPNMRDEAGNSALWHAASSGNHSAIRQLVNDAHTKMQLDVDCENADGTTPLAEAVTWGHGECVHVLVKESGANAKKVEDKARLQYLLREDSHYDSPRDSISLSRPQTGRSIGQASLKLERISLHSRHSLRPPDVEDIQTDCGDPGEGCSTPPDGHVVYHNHGSQKAAKISLELPILNPLPDRAKDHGGGSGTGRSWTHSDAKRDAESISVITKYSLSPRAENCSDEHCGSSSPIGHSSPGASSPSPEMSSLSLPRISSRSPSPGNPDRTPSYDVVHKSGMTSSRNHPATAPKKGGRQRSKSTGIIVK